MITVSDSPYSERMERSGSIRRFLREQFRDDKKKEKQQEKESKECKENKENIANATNSTASSSSTTSEVKVKESNTETKTKSNAYRLFRTVSIAFIFHQYTKY